MIISFILDGHINFHPKPAQVQYYYYQAIVHMYIREDNNH